MTGRPKDLWPRIELLFTQVQEAKARATELGDTEAGWAVAELARELKDEGRWLAQFSGCGRFLISDLGAG